MQIAGRDCALCGEPILGVLDGALCPACCCPVHIRCCAFVTRPGPSCCPRCGSPSAAGSRERREQQQAQQELGRALGREETLRGLLLVLGGGALLIALLFARIFLPMPCFVFLIPAALIAGGIAGIGRGASRQDTDEPDA